MQRLEIASEYLNSHLKTRSELEDLILEAGGEPIRSLIITGHRSGSTFLSAILNAVPGNFHLNEPLIKFKGTETKQIPPTLANDAVTFLKRILKCEVDELNHFLHAVPFKCYPILTDQCNSSRLCEDAQYTSRFCKLFPFQNMKETRLRLKYNEKILQDKDFSKLKAVLLVRDPRAVLRSRRPLPWCGPYRDCWDPALVCRAMVSDHRALVSLQDKFPNRLIAIRFEDLALNPTGETKRLFHFLDRPLGPTIQEFLRAHTNSSRDLSTYSTFRVSGEVPFKWKEDLDYEYVSQIQDSCAEALELWGYRRARSLQHLRSSDFMPLGAYKYLY
ncbi:unnamed protein product [Plutella xylostella]|uniref:(diamondback moth) hypothetical protein n=1 Tax=Plutella xylostella TaxID=51655 RepID=A0A8S4G8P9_PLUXY|nr:unnamed protein product [Plutella xylostella]